MQINTRNGDNMDRVEVLFGPIKRNVAASRKKKNLVPRSRCGQVHLHVAYVVDIFVLYGYNDESAVDRINDSSIL